jgi:hypothetical protein
MKELIQKKGLQKKHYKILDDKLYINIKSTQEHNEWICSLEELGLKKLYKKQSRIVLNIVVFACLIIVLSALLTYIFAPEQIDQRTLYFNMGIWGFIGIFFSLIPTKNEIYLYGGIQDLSFFRNKPDEKTVDQFVDELIEHTKQFLKNKYAKIDKDLNKDLQISNFHWLKNIEVITNEEFEELKEEADRQKLY